MKNHEFWQNFELGTEIDIAGTFIYDGLKNLHQMENFDSESEIFNILYHLSVGLERFLKVAIILVEFDDETNLNSLEESLITHNTSELLNRLIKSHPIKISKQHNELVSLLTKFYKSYRYDRYSIKTINNLSKEKTVFVNFLIKYLSIEPKSTYFGTITYENTPQIKNFIGKLISKLILQIYNIIRDAARNKNIYTYEVNYDSKAAKLLLSQQFTFEKEDILWKELLIFILNNNQRSHHLKFIKDTEPLDFDIALLGEYFEAIGNDTKKINIMDELDYLYDQLNSQDRKNRSQILQLISDCALNFDDDEEE